KYNQKNTKSKRTTTTSTHKSPGAYINNINFTRLSQQIRNPKSAALITVSSAVAILILALGIYSITSSSRNHTPAASNQDQNHNQNPLNINTHTANAHAPLATDNSVTQITITRLTAEPWKVYKT